VSIALDLARLYHLYPKIDPDGRRFRELEIILFDDKAESYVRQDLKAIQAYHTILGLIYAEKSKWTPDPTSYIPRASNAIFQLEHALETAKTRVSQDPTNFQPLPHLEKYLAEAYLKTDKKSLALKQFLKVAESYLDLDELEETEKALKCANPIITAGLKNERELYNSLDSIWKGRKFASEIKMENLNESSPEYWRNNKTAFGWMSSLNIAGFEKGFLNRQIFKTLSDIGDIAYRAGDLRQALLLHTEALKNIENERNLACSDDVIRLRSIRDTIERNLEDKVTKENLQTGYKMDNMSEYKDWHIWSVPSSEMSIPSNVGISPDFRLAAGIGNYLANQHDFKAGELKYSVYKGEVSVVSSAANPDRINLVKDALGKMKGVKNVSVKTIKD
jgi:hypothetical protein